MECRRSLPMCNHSSTSIFLRNNWDKNFSYLERYIYNQSTFRKTWVRRFMQFSRKRVLSRSCHKKTRSQLFTRKLTRVIPTRGVINRNDRVVTRGGQLVTLLRARWIPALISSPSSSLITQLRVIKPGEKSETGVEAVRSRLVVHQTIRGWRVKNVIT